MADQPPTPPKRRSMTLAAIGRRAGVSEATVSKVLNDRPDVAPGTRARVQALLEEYGYGLRERDPNSTMRKGIADLLMINLNDPWAAKMLSTFEQVARARGLDIVPAASLTHAAPAELITRILARGSRGVIAVFADLSPAQRRRLEAGGLPYVVIGQATEPEEMTRSVEIDFRAGVWDATQHLLDLGHRRIGITIGARGMAYTEARLRGYVDALTHADIEVDPELVSCTWYDVDAARQETLSLLALRDPPTAIIAGSDTMAIGVYQAVEESGMRIGSDLAVIGFDDRPEALWLRPALTTARIPVDQLAAAAIDLLLDAEPEALHRTVTPTLVVRDSTGMRTEDPKVLSPIGDGG